MNPRTMKTQRHLFSQSMEPKRARTSRRRETAVQPPSERLEALLAHLIIRASAGTGKTYRLSNRYLQLLFAGTPPETILASTFTRKAAGEIVDRVLYRLAEAALSDEACCKLQEQLGDPSIARERSLELLIQLVRNLHRLRIATLDAFFVQIAQSFSLELGLPPFWQVMEELIDARLRGVAIESLLRDGEKQELLTLVHLLTKGEAQRNVSQLLRDTVNDLYELFLQTDKEAWTRLPHHKSLDGPALAEVIEGLRALQMKRTLEKARDADVQRLLAEDWEGLVERGLLAKLVAGEDRYSRVMIPAEAAAAYAPLIAHVRAVLVNRLAQQTEGAFRFLQRFHGYYQHLKQQQRALSFDDVTRELARHADERLGGSAQLEELAYRLDGRIDHLLLDEFQDTSPTQWQVLRPLAERITGMSGGSFFCVGDVKQAIYAWRGGVAELFHTVESQLRGLEHEALNVSFRSAPPVIETVNQVFSGICRHPSLKRAEEALQRWCERFEEHQTMRTLLPGYTCLLTADCRANGVQGREDTLHFAAEHIARLHEQSPRSSIGVLVRKNDAVARLINELHSRHVHASQEGGNPLTDSAAVRMVLSACQLADHPGDSIAAFHVASSALGRHLGLASPVAAQQAAEVAQQIRRTLLAQGYGATVLQWARVLAADCSRREVNRLEQLVELAYAYQGQVTLRTSDFVAFVQSQKVMDPTAANVRVMTIHQAKGLQFDIVVLPELDFDLVGQTQSFVAHRADPAAPVDLVCRYTSSSIQQLLPPKVQAIFPDATARDVTETLCLLYVALTRAVHALHMIVPASAVNEKTIPRNVAGLLRVALHGSGPVEPQKTLFELGDSRWYQKSHAGKAPSPAAAVAKECKAKGPPPEPQVLRLAPMPSGRQRGLERASPSALEGGQSVRLRDFLTRQSPKARERGTVLHAWFEQIDWVDEATPDDEQLLAALAGIQDVWLAPTEQQQLLSEFRAALGQSEIQELLARRSYDGWPQGGRSAQPDRRIELAKERPFAVRDGQRLIAGTVDRLVVVYDGNRAMAADIIDFKSDQIPANNGGALAERAEFYRPQLEAYAIAVAHSLRLPVEAIRTRIAFVHTGSVVSL